MVKLGWEGTKIIQALQTIYKDDTPRELVLTSGLKDFEMVEKLLKMMRVVEDQQPQKNNKKIDFVRNLVKEDGRLTIYQIDETVGISVGSAHSILHDDLCLSKLLARWVSKALRPNQLNLRSELSMAILLKIEADKDHFFDRIITGDETWVYQYDPETKQQSKQWLSRGSSGPIKFKSERSV